MIRETDLYPNFTSELQYIEENGITEDLISKMIFKHETNSLHSKTLYGRYRTLSNDVPIFKREPRFKTDDKNKAIVNNKINTDFFSEIIDIKVGYFAGKPFVYKYNDDSDSMYYTGGENAVYDAVKALKDFVKINNMFDCDMEATKFASICGYCGRLFYVNKDKEIRCMIIPPFETIILYKNEMTEPSYALRYYSVSDLYNNEKWKAEFYDSNYIYYYQGQKGNFKFIKKEKHLFNRCPLQGIPNNHELMGDTEKVISLIDDYDRRYSDAANDIENFSNAYMVFKNIDISEEMLKQANETGAFAYDDDSERGNAGIEYLTKELNDTPIENHLNRGMDNIYRVSKSPNLNDPEFNAASGIALKIKMTGLETKCGILEAKHASASTYMFKLISDIYNKLRIKFDAMQCSVTYRRNFPVDFLGDAQAVQALISAGLPKQIAFKALSFIDDVDYIMQLIEDEKNGIFPLDEELPEDKLKTEINT